jgi:NAD(P)-dependent dehydrogenase (short-subunit alcohol dehydrogenase family)
MFQTDDLIVTPFSFSSTASEVLNGVDLSGKRAIVTGGAAGIGLETARVLAAAGASVVVAVRRPHDALPVIDSLRHETGNKDISVVHLDLADLASVDRLAAGWTGPLHILVNNAGIMAVPERQTTAQGIELQFATNYLGHFALVLALYKALRAAEGARVVSLSSSGHLFSPVVFDDLNFDFMPYTPFGAYGQSKTAAVLLSVGITDRWASEGILSNALNPGAIATGLQKHTGGLKTPVELQKTVQEGASTSVLLAASPLLAGVSGRYFENCNEAHIVQSRPTDYSGGLAAYAIDHDNADRLWELARRLVGN